MWLERAVPAQVVRDAVRLGARVVERDVVEHVARPDQHALCASWKPSATTRGGPSKRAGVACARETGINGPWCEPRMNPFDEVRRA